MYITKHKEAFKVTSTTPKTHEKNKPPNVIESTVMERRNQGYESPQSPPMRVRSMPSIRNIRILFWKWYIHSSRQKRSALLSTEAHQGTRIEEMRQHLVGEVKYRRYIKKKMGVSVSISEVMNG